MNPLKNAKILMLAILLSSLTFIQDCRDPEVRPSPFEWVVKGARLSYDLHTSTANFTNARTLEVDIGTGKLPPMIFEERMSDATNVPYKNRPLLGMFTEVLPKPDGLYTSTCYSCSIGACFGSKQYLKVPHQPVKSQAVPNYACAEKISGYDVVISVDSVIRVPLGEFQTIVMLDTLTQTVKFWNEKTGLIRVDNFQEGASDTIKLFLASKNY